MTRTLALALLLSLTALGCTSVATGPSPDPAPARQPATDGEYQLIPWRFQFDPATASGGFAPDAETRAASGFQATLNDLDPVQFLKNDTLRLLRFQVLPNGDYEFTFVHVHPFEAPQLAIAPSFTNRADLGYTGVLLFLTDLPGAPGPGTSFFGGEALLNPDLLVRPDGFLNPGDLLSPDPAMTANTFPYILLCDEAENNRLSVSNGGDPRGNYDAAIGGWQRTNLGATNDGWTGYDFVHQGQSVYNTFTIDHTVLGSDPLDFTVALMIRYSQPKGAGGQAEPEWRLPREPVAPLEFAYRLPYAALDGGKITTSAPGVAAVELTDAADDSGALVLRVRDYDTNALASGDADLSDETDVALVQPGATGEPSVEVDCPVLRPAATPLALTGGSGVPGDELLYAGALTNVLGTALPGNYWALARVTDPEADDPLATDYHFGIDAVTLQPDADRALAPITYQAVPVLIEPSLSFTTYAIDTANTVGRGTSMATLPGGGIVLAYVDVTNRDVRVAIATTAPTGPGSWTVYTIYGTGNTGFTTDVAVIPGHIAVALTNYTSDGVFIAVSDDLAPLALSDWSSHRIPTPANAYLACTMTPLTNGRLAVAMVENTAGDPLIAVATADLPVATGDWGIHYIEQVTNFTGYEPSLGLDGQGQPILAHRDTTAQDLRVSVASTQTPSQTADWSTHVVESGIDPYGPQVALSQGNTPVIAYHAYLPGDSRLRVAVASTGAPSQTSDWALMDADTNGDVGGTPALGRTADGRLVMSCFDFLNQDLKLVRSLDDTPESLGDWRSLRVEPAGSVGTWTCLQVLGDGRIAIGYHDEGAGDLRFALSQTPG